MEVTLWGIVRLVRLVQYENALLPIVVTLLGIVTLVRPVHWKNRLLGILVTPLPKVIESPLFPDFINGLSF